MYYPYLRGKQFELILLRDNAEFLSENNTQPIIEPVKSDFKALIRTVKVLDEKEVACMISDNSFSRSTAIKIPVFNSDRLHYSGQGGLNGNRSTIKEINYIEEQRKN